MKKINQKGFGIWELLLLLLLLLILLALGWWVWNQKNDNKPADNSSSSSQQQAEPKKEEQKPAAEKPKETPKKYLEIKELSVKIELNAAIDDAYYIMKDGYAYLSLTSLKNADPECAADKTGVAAIGAYTKTDINDMSGKTYEEQVKAGGSGVIIGNKAYVLDRSQAYCSEKVDVQTKQQAAWDGFLTQAKTIQSL